MVLSDVTMKHTSFTCSEVGVNILNQRKVSLTYVSDGNPSHNTNTRLFGTMKAMRFRLSTSKKCTSNRNNESLLNCESSDETSLKAADMDAGQTVSRKLLKLPRFRRLVEYEDADSTSAYIRPTTSNDFFQGDDENEDPLFEAKSPPPERKHQASHKKSRFQRLGGTKEFGRSFRSTHSKKTMVTKKVGSMDTASCSDMSNENEYEPPSFPISIPLVKVESKPAELEDGHPVYEPPSFPLTFSEPEIFQQVEKSAAGIGFELSPFDSNRQVERSNKGRQEKSLTKPVKKNNYQILDSAPFSPSPPPKVVKAEATNGSSAAKPPLTKGYHVLDSDPFSPSPLPKATNAVEENRKVIEAEDNLEGAFDALDTDPFSPSAAVGACNQEEEVKKGCASGLFSPTVHDTPSARQSIASTPEQEQGDEFRQLFFDEGFNRIEKVTIERSDAGTNSFVDLAGKLATNLTPVKQTSSKIVVTKESGLASKAKESFKKSASLRFLQKTGTSQTPPQAKLPDLETRDKTAFIKKESSQVNISTSSEPEQPRETESFGFKSVDIDDIDWTDSKASTERQERLPTEACDKIEAATKMPVEVQNSLSADDALLVSIKSSSIGVEERSVKPDPSPRVSREVPIFQSRSKERNHKSAVKQKVGMSDNLMSPQQIKPRKAGTNDVILGSMLFQHTRPKPAVKSPQESEVDEIVLGEIPASVNADAASQCTVSSVTEGTGTSSFYQKRFGWDKQAQSVLNKYHQLRSTRDPNRYRAPKVLKSVEEEHLTMFQAS